MPNFASRITNIKPSATGAVAEEVRKLKAAGTDVISFSIGVPGFLPPSHVYAAAEQAAQRTTDTGAYLPGRGQPALIEAFRARLAKDGFTYETNEVCAALGGKHALYNIFQVLCEAGDEVIFPSPYWTSYADIPVLADATVKPIHCSAAEDYKLTPEKLAAAITPQTKVFLFNNPSNPTGMVYTQAEVQALADELAKHPHVWIISDDIYDKLIYDGAQFHHLLHARPELRERTAIVQSVSKTYGMPGWRIGMLAAPQALVDQVVKLISQSVMNFPPVNQAAAAAAFAGDHSFLEPLKAEFTRKRNMTMEALSGIDGVTCPMPGGAFYAFPEIAGVLARTGGDDIAFSQALLREKQVAVVPGSAFGNDQAIRISYACDEDELAEGLTRLTDFLRTHR